MLRMRNVSRLYINGMGSINLVLEAKRVLLAWLEDIKCVQKSIKLVAFNSLAPQFLR